MRQLDQLSALQCSMALPASRAPSVASIASSDSGNAPNSGIDHLSSPPSLLSIWENHVDFGIIHPRGCIICCEYMKHLSSASYSASQPSFQIAMKDRVQKREMIFEEGVIEGCRRQKCEDERLVVDIERYRAERNEALETLGRYRMERNLARDELSLCQARVQELQTMCTNLKWQGEQPGSRNIAPSPPSPPSPQSLEERRVPMSIMDENAKMVSIGLAETHNSRIETNDPGEQWKFEIFTEDSESGPTPLAPIVPVTYAEAASLSAPAASTRPMHLSTFSHVPTQRSQNPDTTHQSTDPKIAILHSNARSQVKAPKSIRQLEALMLAAHKPGNYDALRKVKGLCSQAHLAPREEKTDLQRYLLANWRNPAYAIDDETRRLNVSSSSQLLNNPRLDDPIENWVAYYSVHRGSWPKGVREDTEGKPVVSDVRASRILSRMRPDGDPTNGSALRHRFMACVTRLFSEPGLYQACLDRVGMRVARVAIYRQFSASIEETTIERVAYHAAESGITVTLATNDIGPWAREYYSQTSASGHTVEVTLPPWYVEPMSLN